MLDMYLLQIEIEVEKGYYNKTDICNDIKAVI